MSISLPSREVYAVDVPEIKELTAEFKYNFFMPDESVSDTGGVPTVVLERPAAEVDASFVQYAITRVPRFVTLNFKLPRLADVGNQVSDVQQRNVVFGSKAQNGSLISDNLDKVVTEDHFASNNFIAVNFQDADLDDKLHYLVSGTYVQHTLDQPKESNVSHYKAAQRLHAVMPKYIKPHFLFRGLAHPTRAHGTRFFRGGRRFFNSYFRRLKSVVVNAQINGKLFHDVVNRTIKDPHAPFAADLHNIHKLAKQVKQSNQHSSGQVLESDYKTFVPFIDINAEGSAHYDKRGAEIVGYIIDKFEITKNGQALPKEPIVIDNPVVSFTIDPRVKYNTTYAYSIRTVAQFVMPAIDDETGATAVIKALVSSKPSNRVYVQTTEMVAPPPPADINFTWDYERINPTTAEHDPETGEPLPGTGKPGSLLVHWTFPPNSQRDIKKFQVFRRSSVDHPFELVQMYDFDDSIVKFSDREDPDPSLVDHITSPATFYYDDDFLQESRYIYTTACIDAHGLTSNYSAQFEVWFDPFKNKLQKKLISHAGAPKPYPNLYLEVDTFVDTIRVGGPGSKHAKLYFNPEYYYLYDDNNRLTRLLATKQTGGKYQAQFINIDNQKSVALDVEIDDRFRAATATLSFPEVRFGARRPARVHRGRGRGR